MITLSLPYPPTANNLFKNTLRGRARTPAYNAWIEAALWEIKAQRPNRIGGFYEMVLTAGRPDRLRRDITNLVKPVEDVLVKAGIVEDDSKAVCVTAQWAEGAPIAGGTITVCISPWKVIPRAAA